MLGGVALLASAAWWAGVAGLMGPLSGARVAEERAEVDALEVSPAPSSETVATPSPADVDAPDARVDIDDGTGQASLTVDGDTVELELTACTTGGRMTDRHLRGEGPDGRIAVHSSRGRTLVAVDTDADRQVLVGQRRGGQASGPAGEGVELEVAGKMRELLAGEVVDVELAASCR